MASTVAFTRSSRARVKRVAAKLNNASISNVRTQLGQTQALNSALVEGLGCETFRQEQVLWLGLSPTGTNIAGRWMEVDDSQPELLVGMQEHYWSTLNKILKDTTDPRIGR